MVRFEPGTFHSASECLNHSAIPDHNNVIQENINDEFDTYMQQEHTDSDSTVIYKNQEKEIGTIYFFQKETKNKDHHKHQSLPHLLYFKCPQTNCKFRSNKRKVTNKHYKLDHKFHSFTGCFKL